MELLNHLNWRYATKRYNTTKKISEEAIEQIKTAIQLAPSSYGLQLFEVLHIKDIALREQLKAVGYNQPQITEASDLFVFCHYADAHSSKIDDYLALKAKIQGSAVEDLAEYGAMMKGAIDALSIEEKQIWMAKQVYIALSNGLMACASLGIDSSPMEGFVKAAFDKLLKLEDQGLKSTVILAMGYRSVEDETQHQTKVRKPLEELFTSI